MAAGTLDSASRPNALAEQAWAEVAALIDLQLSPLGLRAIEALEPKADELIIDIGCGAGETVLQLAERVGPEGQVIGVDIAPLLLRLARGRAASLRQVSFIEADAQSIDLPAHTADGVFSRFGVMAFVDPLAAFANFHRILKPNGRLAFVCWRTLEENELDILPLRAAELEQMADTTPFRFAEPGFVRTTLGAAGFRAVRVEAHDQLVSSGNLQAMASVLLKVGPLGRIVRENPGLLEMSERRVCAALRKKARRGRVSLNAATWIVTAEA